MPTRRLRNHELPDPVGAGSCLEFLDAIGTQLLDPCFLVDREVAASPGLERADLHLQVVLLGRRRPLRLRARLASGRASSFWPRNAPPPIAPRPATTPPMRTGVNGDLVVSATSPAIAAMPRDPPMNPPIVRAEPEPDPTFSFGSPIDGVSAPACDAITARGGSAVEMGSCSSPSVVRPGRPSRGVLSDLRRIARRRCSVERSPCRNGPSDPGPARARAVDAELAPCRIERVAQALAAPAQRQLLGRRQSRAVPRDRQRRPLPPEVRSGTVVVTRTPRARARSSAPPVRRRRHRRSPQRRSLRAGA